MKEFFPVLRSSQLFSGVSEEELTAMLTCLGAEKRSFPKEAFLLPASCPIRTSGCSPIPFRKCERPVRETTRVSKRKRHGN